jgi:ATP-dependent RNA helicase HelY
VKKPGKYRRPSPEQGIFRPRASKLTQPLLNRIGLPEKTPFKPDPFQSRAVELAREHDVLVSAPTGSGKTWIAEKAMEELLQKGGRSWYASPLKALSNSKLLEFRGKFGDDRVGILTGDRKENSDAPLIVGTTEILRNQLYDAMAEGKDLNLDLVILDEAHYLDDPDRGVVWEEVIIYLPARVRLLLLSATLANAEELSGWLAGIRKQPYRIVAGEERPVPLNPIFMAPDGIIMPLIKEGRLSPGIAHLLNRRKSLFRAIPLNRVMTGLETLNLLPAIFFLTSRADCDKAVARMSAPKTKTWASRLDELNREIDLFLEKYGFLRGHRMIPLMRRYGVASHHAGHLPHFKLLVERLMQKGLLRAIFSTSTVAAGVNFPARTVVISNSDRFNGRDFQNLSATELTQMTGRAGRRGKDRVGFALFLPGPHQDLSLMAALVGAPPDPIQGQMHLSFSMVLNLLMSHTPEMVKTVLSLSLAVYQSAGAEPQARPRYLDRLARELEQSNCGEIGRALVQRRTQARLEGRKARLEQGWERMEEDLRMRDLLLPGRIFLDLRSRPWMAMRRADRKGRPGVLAVRLGPKIKLNHGRLRLKFVGRDRIGAITAETVPIVGDRQLLPRLRKLSNKEFRPLEEKGELSLKARESLAQAREELARLESELSGSPCLGCGLAQKCLAFPPSSFGENLNRAEDWLQRLAQERERLWMGFLSRVDFLIQEGFLGQDHTLTDLGLIAAALRVDHPLIMARAVLEGVLPEDNPALLAALTAPFVLDRDRAWQVSLKKFQIPGSLESAFRKVEKSLAPLAGRQLDAGFEAPRFLFSPALAVYGWARGTPFEELTKAFQVEAGDLASLILRTAENLRQFRSLKKTHPQLVDCSRKAGQAILREPVIVPD